MVLKELIQYIMNFCLNDSLEKNGIMRWTSHAGKGTIKGRENPIILENNYLIQWKKYSEIDDHRSGVFKYLLLSLAF